MNEVKISINKDELEQALELMNRFDCDSMEFVKQGGSGIGYILQGHFPVSIADTSGVYIVEITGVKDW
jgi:hypothetical protein